jgi:hypothetical protein
VTYVVDTGILVDHLRERPEGTATVARALASGRRLTCSVLGRVELRKGVGPHEAPALDALEPIVEWVPVDHEIAALAAAHAERYGRSHAAIDVTDYVIAATAERLGADLLTRDVRDFPMFPDLEAPY